jgi:hypothetical protein
MADFCSGKWRGENSGMQRKKRWGRGVFKVGRWDNFPTEGKEWWEEWRTERGMEVLDLWDLKGGEIKLGATRMNGQQTSIDDGDGDLME